MTVSENYGGIEKETLCSYIERIENLENEKADISEHIRDVFKDAKNDGFDTKIMKEIIKIRKMENHERDEKDALLELYRKVIGV